MALSRSHKILQMALLQSYDECSNENLSDQNSDSDVVNCSEPDECLDDVSESESNTEQKLVSKKEVPYYVDYNDGHRLYLKTLAIELTRSHMAKLQIKKKLEPLSMIEETDAPVEEKERTKCRYCPKKKENKQEDQVVSPTTYEISTLGDTVNPIGKYHVSALTPYIADPDEDPPSPTQPIRRRGRPRNPVPLADCTDFLIESDESALRKNSLVHDAVPAHYSGNDKNVFFETHEDKTPEKLTLTRECNPRVYENKMLLSNQSSVVDSNYDIENSPTSPISYGLQVTNKVFMTKDMKIRIVDPTSRKVDKKLKLFRVLLNLEKRNPSLASSYARIPVDVLQELPYCQTKLDELKTLVQDFEDKPLSSEYNKLTTKLQHLERRLDYMSSAIDNVNKPS
ncbi:hypothetical protein RN001_008868 [Aquatica leii]|uniref:Uncharacterized protein n=1 Tax=Aquatica leii TaxID=1421715 RepID=A0AAN7PA63_9COLE|nr:hypothetical protein RN001_008868 [Aquatica leii]